MQQHRMSSLLSLQTQTVSVIRWKDSVRGRLTFTEDEQPMVAHIWGDKPEFLEK